jgi:hypothetical protein
VIANLLSGEYKNPVRVVAFNTAEKWSQDVSADVAHELRHRCDEQMRDVPFGKSSWTGTRAGIAISSSRFQCGWFEPHSDAQAPAPSGRPPVIGLCLIIEMADPRDVCRMAVFLPIRLLPSGS